MVSLYNTSVGILEEHFCTACYILFLNWEYKKTLQTLFVYTFLLNYGFAFAWDS